MKRIKVESKAADSGLLDKGAGICWERKGGQGDRGPGGKENIC